ncbi:MAG: oligopeptide transporter, OPT family [Lachnospiraceae bacterium]|jgi:oligopeptide transporter, OPT family|nr:oligopeptide transporter, OPT family [Lachnospiraceae bacterium]OLA28822.1 MAG: oligopeptide transporter, OPT family [Firmicutes bacterium CAG_194_44_15]HCI17534.1 oligopeptide transporter, OPT family [Lachnospiraceae bacterium]HCX41463.1 oligopeptide transporter, OPT family [Lachnospiraceae bacterium]
MNEKETFKPYISADRTLHEMTPLSIIVGIILAIVFGAANAYLGLRVGMTVSASIPAAVLGMGVYRLCRKKDTILESNMVQTIGSAGESLAAGAIFTMPALFLWAQEEGTKMPGIMEIALIALIGGLLGICFMVPLRKALIVKEHGTLPYPEGTACAEVLLAGEKGGANASVVFLGMGIAALFKFIVDGLKVVSSAVTVTVQKIHGEISAQVYPALVSVGYICGFKIASYMFAGGILGWLVLIPMIYLFGADTTLFPASVSVHELWEQAGASGIWSSYIRYIGAGAVATGGIVSLIKSLPLIVRTFADAMKGLKGSGKQANELRTEKDLKMSVVLIMLAILIVAIAVTPIIPIDVIGAIVIVIFGFFFATVSSRMVGLVGSSNNPVSGMAIATLLATTVLLKATGHTGMSGMTAAIAIGSVICIVAAMAGDMSQDLKTGYILGATPVKQQYGEMIGTVVSAVTIGFVLYLLNAAWGFGTPELSAPQATLMKMIVEGVMGGNLPWTLVFIGVFIALVVELLGIPVLPFAIGLYLPIELSSCIMIGGVLRWALEKKKYKSGEQKESAISNGVLCCSGMIAGEGLIGILLAVFAVVKVNGRSLAEYIDLSGSVNLGQIGALVVLALVILSILKFTIWNKKVDKE